MTDSFAHHVRIEHIRDGELFELVADEGERGSVAQRLGLQALSRLEARAMVHRKGQVVHAEGRVTAVARSGLRDHRRAGAGACR